MKKDLGENLSNIKSDFDIHIYDYINNNKVNQREKEMLLYYLERFKGIVEYCITKLTEDEVD